MCWCRPSAAFIAVHSAPAGPLPCSLSSGSASAPNNATVLNCTAAGNAGAGFEGRGAVRIVQSMAEGNGKGIRSENERERDAPRAAPDR